MGATIVATILAIAGAGGTAFNLSSAKTWRERSSLLDSIVLAKRKEIARSQADVARLEERIRSLANEKAQAEDKQAIAAEQARFFASIAQLNAGVARELSDCLDSWDRFVQVVVFDPVAAGPLAEESDRICGKARSDYHRLNELLERL